jgi:hypothetical protein
MEGVREVRCRHFGFIIRLSFHPQPEAQAGIRLDDPFACASGYGFNDCVVTVSEVVATSATEFAWDLRLTVRPRRGSALCHRSCT